MIGNGNILLLPDRRKPPPPIEYLVRKAAPTGTNKGRGSLIVCDLRARSLPTFPDT